MVPISWSKWAHIEVWGHVQFSEARLPLRMRLYLTHHVVIDNSVCWGGVWSCVWGPFSCFVVLGLDSSLMETECIHLSHHQGNARARLNLRLRGCRIPQWCQDQETIFSLPQFSSDREREPAWPAEALAARRRGKRPVCMPFGVSRPNTLLPLVPLWLSSANTETFTQMRTWPDRLIVRGPGKERAKLWASAGAGESVPPWKQMLCISSEQSTVPPKPPREPQTSP